MAGRLPDFLIAGAPRSGTTTLNAYLRDHRSVFMAPSKEVRFFDLHWDRGEDWYRSELEGSAPHQLVGEASPRYLGHAEALDRIRQLLPNVRLVAIIRNPVDRAHSHYYYRSARGLEGFSSFEEALAAERNGVAGAFPYVGLGRYGAQLTRAEALFSRQQICVLQFEDLGRAPEFVLDELASFLEIPPFEAPDALRVNSADSFRSIRIRNMAKGRPWPLPSLVARFNRREAPYPSLPSGLRQQLVDELAEDRQMLESFTGRDFSHWQAPEPQMMP